MGIADSIVSSIGSEGAPAPQAAEPSGDSTNVDAQNPGTPSPESPQTSEVSKEEGQDIGGKDETQGKDLEFAKRFNVLTRREKQINEKNQEVSQKWNEVQEFQKDREMIKEDPVSFLEKHGWKFNDLAEFVLNDKKKTPESQISELQKRLESFENEKKKESETKEQEQKRKQEEETINSFKKNIEDTVKQNTEEFELVNQFGEYETVYQVIENYYNQHNTILDVKEAAKHVEKYLEGQLEKASGTKKFKSRFHSALDQRKEEEGTSQTPRTLSNDQVTSSSGSEAKSEGYLPYEESIQRSADLIRQAWQKKRS